MEMWLKRSTLLFFTVIVAAKMTSGQSPVILGRETTKVEVPFGSPLFLICNLNTAGFERFRMNWYFSGSGPPFNQTNAISHKLSNRKNSSVGKDDGQDTEETCFKYTLNATHNNSGFYYCEVKVEIPQLMTIVSVPREVVITNRVELTTHPSLPIVTSKQATVSPTESFSLWWLWITLGVSAVILSILLLTYILLRRRCRRSREEPIYANTHSCSKQPSPRMPVDNLKTVPSSQNLRNPSPGRRYDEGKRKQRH